MRQGKSGQRPIGLRSGKPLAEGVKIRNGDCIGKSVVTVDGVVLDKMVTLRLRVDDFMRWSDWVELRCGCLCGKSELLRNMPHCSRMEIERLYGTTDPPKLFGPPCRTVSSQMGLRA